jgi:hypothetical protein
VSQYPYPYTPPSAQPDYGAYADYDPRLTPARHAAVLQMVIGTLGLCCGLCIGVAVWVVPIDQIVRQANLTLPDTGGLSITEFFHIVFTVVAILGGIVGLTLILLAIGVRKGGTASIITSIVINCAIGLYMLINLVFGGIQVVSNPSSALGLLVVAAILGLQGWLLVLLFKASAAARQIKSMLAQQAMYWQMMHQQQQLQAPAAGYGYSGYAVAPQPPAGQPPVNFGSAPAAEEKRGTDDVPPT